MVAPRRGEIWRADLDPVRGREQAGRRPVIVMSADTFNRGPRKLLWILPLTRTRRTYSTHVEVQQSETGLPYTSYVMCEQLRSISVERLVSPAPIGHVSRATISQIELIVSDILYFPEELAPGIEL